MAVKMMYLVPDKAQIDVLVHQPPEMAFGDQLIHSDVVEQGLASAVLSEQVCFLRMKWLYVIRRS